MQELEYQVSFTTPAFLGNAEQLAQWRTPPFKALLRHWWRVANARHYSFDWKQMRVAEGGIFGSASDDGAGSMKSRLRLRLSTWAQAPRGAWELGGQRIKHPECPMPVDASLYLGYGPLTFDRNSRATALHAKRSFLPAGDSASLRVALQRGPHQSDPTQQIMNALQLASWFGAVGSRSRNGWGSLRISPTNTQGEALSIAALEPFTRDFQECMKLDWPHAIGHDGQGPLVWISKKHYPSLKEAIKVLAIEKIALRTDEAPFRSGDSDAAFDRHLMGYPVTNHVVRERGWSHNGRLGSQLRWKIESQGGLQYRILVVHTPCGLPEFMKSAYRAGIKGEISLWERAHQHLDRSAVVGRLAKEDNT